MAMAASAGNDDFPHAAGSKRYGVVHTRHSCGLIVLIDSRPFLWRSVSIEAVGLAVGDIAMGKHGRFRIIETPSRRKMAWVELVKWGKAPAARASVHDKPAVPYLRLVTPVEVPGQPAPLPDSASIGKGKRKRRRSVAADVISGAIVSDTMQHSRAIQQALKRGADAINDIGRRLPRNTPASRAGLVSEGDHAVTFMTDGTFQRKAAQAGRYISYETKSADLGYRKDSGSPVRRASLKACGTAKKTASAQRGYGSQTLVCPSDQVHEVVRHASRREVVERTKGPHRERVRQDWDNVKKHATDRIKDGSVESQPRTLKETRELGEKAKHGQVMPKDIAGGVAQRAWDGAKAGLVAGAKTGAALGTALNCCEAIRHCYRGEEKLPDVVVTTIQNIAADTATSAAKGMAAGAAEGAAQVLATRTASSLAGTVLRSGAAGASAMVLVDVVRSTFRLAKGDIDEEEYKTEIKEASGSGVLSFVGGLIGSLFGPLGSLVGSIALPFLGRRLAYD